MSFSLLYVTHPDPATAKRIGQALLDKKLIACYNLLPIESAYWWQGQIESAQEQVTLLKTTNELAARVEEEVIALHPYTTPCVMRIQVSANRAYEAWIEAEVSTG